MNKSENGGKNKQTKHGEDDTVRKHFTAINTDRETQDTPWTWTAMSVFATATWKDPGHPGPLLPGCSAFWRGLLTSLLLCWEKRAGDTEEGVKGDLKASTLKWDDSVETQITRVTTTISSKCRVSKRFCFCHIYQLAPSPSCSKGKKENPQ